MDDIKNMNIYEKLMHVQNELNVPKTRVNNFAKKPFNYRNAEDILSAVKPIAAKYGCVVLVPYKVKIVGERYYTEATAIFADGISEPITAQASARESDSRSGWDVAQITGSASSYARKYALNGLLGLDDEQDPDALNDSNQGTNAPAQAQINHPIPCTGCGKNVTAQEHDWSVKHFGRILCRACQQKIASQANAK